MKIQYQTLDLIDLISERHISIRALCEKAWNNSSNIPISNSEWFIMARIYKNQPTISHVSKNVDISRQATHKFVKKLEAKGLVKIQNVEGNNKDKCVQLTELGELCYEKNEAFKASLIETITNQIGEENVRKLHEILEMDWGL